MAQSPCFFTPLADSLLSPFFVPFTYLETLLAVTGSVHLSLRLLVNWPPLPQPFPIPSPLQIPSTQVKYAPHYDDFKNPASLVRNTNLQSIFRRMSPYKDWCMPLKISKATPPWSTLWWWIHRGVLHFPVINTPGSQLFRIWNKHQNRFTKNFLMPNIPGVKKAPHVLITGVQYH
jgi:hypothetical protein